MTCLIEILDGAKLILLITETLKKAKLVYTNWYKDKIKLKTLRRNTLPVSQTNTIRPIQMTFFNLKN
jgi:hypothetical protein